MRRQSITFHPRFTTAHPLSVIMDRRLHTGVTITGYTIIVVAAVAIDFTKHAAVCPISFPSTAFASEETGTVKWFSAEKGCGVVVPDDSENDVSSAFHLSLDTGPRPLSFGE